MTVREQIAHHYPLRTHATRSPRSAEPSSDGAEPLTEDFSDLARMASIVRRYDRPQQTVPVRMVVHDQRKQRRGHLPQPQRKNRPQYHPMTYVGLGTAIPVVFFLLVNWWNGYQEEAKYGMPRTYQVDAKVGHGDITTPSHFIAVNLNKRVIIIEFLGGDTSRAVIYQGPTLFGSGQEKAPVTLEFRDLNADGLIDMLLVIVNVSHYIYFNEGQWFRPLKMDEPIGGL